MGNYDDRGPQIVDGKIQYWNSSMISAADPGDRNGCLLKFWFEWKSPIGVHQEETPAMVRGTKIHKELELYAESGDSSVLGDLAVSARVYVPMASEKVRNEASLEGAMLGRPFLGTADVVNLSGSWINDDGDTIVDGIPEIRDWKTKGDIKYALNPLAIAKTIQMPAYGKLVLDSHGGDRIRLTHVTIAPNGVKTTTTVQTRGQVNARWQYVESVAKLMDHVLTLDKPDVSGNLRACRAYNRRCPYYKQCPTANFNSLESFDPNLVQRIKRKGDDMSIKDILEGKKQTVSLDDLLAEESAAVETAKAVPKIKDEVRRWITQIASYNVGTPRYGVAAWQIDPPSGKLRNLDINTEAELSNLATELSAKFGSNSVVPIDAPASKPELAADPVEDLPVDPPKVEAADPEPEIVDEIPAVSGEPRKRGRPRKIDQAVKPPSTSQAYADLTNESLADDPLVRLSDQPWVLLLGALTCSLATDLYPEVTRVIGLLAGGRDPRLADGKAFEFGRWKAVVSAACAEINFVPGLVYTFNDGGSDLYQAAAEGLRIAALRNNAIVVLAG